MTPDDISALLPNTWQPYLALAAFIYATLFIALPAALHPIVLVLSRLAGLTETLWDDEVVGALGRFARGLDWIHARMSPFIPSALAHNEPENAQLSKSKYPPDKGAGPGASIAVSAILVLGLAAILASCNGMQSVRRTRTVLASSAEATALVDRELNTHLQDYVNTVEACASPTPPETGCDGLVDVGQRIRRGVVALQVAVQSLRAAETAVDAWAEGLSSCNALASIPPAVRAVAELLEAVELAGLDLPDAVQRLAGIAEALLEIFFEAENQCEVSA